MAAIVYIKSLLWLVGLGGLGFGLMQLTTPSQRELDEIKAKNKAAFAEGEKQKIQFLQKLKETASK